MKKVMCRILPVLVIAMVIAVVSGVAVAQQGGPIGEEFTTNYYANNTTSGAPPAWLRFTEHGSIADRECAMIYVFAPDQQLTECCGCLVTANGLQTINVQTQLLGNTLTRVTPNTGVIQIVSGLPTSGGLTGPKGNNSPLCDPTNVAVAPEIDSWVTHVQNKVGATFPITESRGDEEFLSDAEFSNITGSLEADCAFAERLGSGFGVCDCGKFENVGDGLH